MRKFQPDYKNIVDAAKNITPKRLPLYEHIICDKIMECILGKEFAPLSEGSFGDKLEYFKIFSDFFRTQGFDTVTYEGCFSLIFPGGGALGCHKQGVINSRDDFVKYPWDSLIDAYFDRFQETFSALRATMPEGMSAIGGVGNGVFECVQDLVGYEQLCYMAVDDPELYADMFCMVGDKLCQAWGQLLDRFGDLFCVCRFGDDLGFKSQTLLPARDIREHIIPQYKRIIQVIHSYGKPFLLHSCGCIFDVMDDLIDVALIDAKHSNEDQIAPFPVWVEKYGERIGNFGGLDTDMVCRGDLDVIREYSLEVLHKCNGKGGFAFGTGNAIADYISPERWLAMVETARAFRGD